MLKALFSWFDANHWSYWAIASVPSALLVLCLVRTFTAKDGEGPLAPRRVDWRYAVLLFIFLLGWRWPPLLGIRELNPDESWMLAGAITLRHDLLFWRSVDGITSGPLNFYGLLPLNYLGVPLDYFGARLTGLLMVWGALTATYAMFRNAAGTRIARFAVLPGLAFFAGATDGDFIHYSSEHASILLSGIGLWLLWSYRPSAEDRPGTANWRWLAGGAVIGLLPWAKLQSGPIGAALGAWGAWLAFSHFQQPLRSRLAQIAKLAAATLAPSVAFMLTLAAFGVFPDFWKSYVLDNLTYVANGFPLAGVVRDLTRLSLFTWHYPVFLLGIGIVASAALVERLVRLRAPGPLHWWAMFFSLVGCYVTVAPGRGFHHYLLYTALPFALWAGAAYRDLAEAIVRRWGRALLAVGFVAVTVALPLYVRATKVAVPWIYGHFLEYWRNPYDEAGKVLVKYRRDGDTLGLWGWYGHAYVQANLPQAQREAESEHQLRDWPLRDTYFRPQYMQEIRRNRPAIFVDAVGPDAFFFNDRAKFAHETFPELQEFIAENYSLVSDVGYARIYVRKDRLAETL